MTKGTHRHQATETTLETEEKERAALRSARSAGLWPKPTPLK